MVEAAWPVELFVPKGRHRLDVVYSDGTRHALPAEFLRVLTPSAERTGHGARLVIGGKAGVRIADVVPVGRYAVRVVFDDGHATGLYTFATLRRYGAERERLWAEYLAELAATGLSRERAGAAPAPVTPAGAG